MSPSREQMLHEMGLTPRWTLRADRSVRRAAPEALAEAVAGMAAKTASPAPASASRESPSPPAGAESPLPGNASAPAAAGVARFDWDELRQGVAACRACALCQQRKQAVLGVGDVRADCLFIGEGPGAEEDERGEPFVGQAGKLLDAMLAAIDLRRGEAVYIANAVKCRPPENRAPEAGELAACRPFLQRQIALIQPRLIVLLGRAAAHAVLGEQGSLASLRGKPLVYRADDFSAPVVVTYHPAYLLRTLPDKALAWEDLCRVRSLLQKRS